MINKPKLLVEFAEKTLIDKEIPTLGPIAFVQHCILEVDRQSDQMELSANVADDEGFAGRYSPSLGHAQIYNARDCLDLWKQIDETHRLKKPIPGSLVIWKKSSGKGHIGIITKILDNGAVEIIEATDSGKISKIKRSLSQEKDLALLGFIRPWH